MTQHRSLAVAIALLALASPAAAQDGIIVAAVTDSSTAAPLGSAIVRVAGSLGSSVTAITTRRGDARVTGLANDTYAVSVLRVGFTPASVTGIRVAAGATVEVTVRMRPIVNTIDPVVVTASRSAETAFDAPRSVSVVSRDEVQAQPALSTIDRIAALPGVEVIDGGMVQRRYTVRGQNFETLSQLRTIIDSRWAVVPNVDHNLPYMMPVNDDDIDRIELLRGPAAALYGPNTNRGILHIITRSPFRSEGTSLSITGGDRRYLQGAFRHAQVLSPEWAFKVSGNYVRGHDWVVTDSSEIANRAALIASGARADTLLVGKRDPDFEIFGGEARLDWRSRSGSDLVLTLGTSAVRSLFDPLTFGGLPVQMTNVWNTSATAEFRRGRFRANAFVNQAAVDSSVYLTTNGLRLADRSTAMVAQVLNGFDLNARQSVTYGAEAQYTIPRTLETQHQFTEGHDDVTEAGVFAHLETSFSPRWDFIASARADYNSALRDAAFSPSAALVFKPTPNHAFRLSYATGFATPGTGILFNDYPAATFGPYQLRALGMYQDLTFRRDCAGGLCMRSPFAPDPSAYLPAEATQMWPAMVALLKAQGVDISAIPAPTAAAVRTTLAELNLTTGGFDPVQASDVTDLSRWKRLTHRTLEAGYKGVLGGNAVLTIDLHGDEMGPVLSERTVPTPNVFFDAASLTSYLTTFMPAANAAQLAGSIATIPLGTVTPVQANVPTALMMIELTGGTVWYWGLDIGTTYDLNNDWRLQGSYSFTSKDAQAHVAGRADLLFLNPMHRGSLGIDYGSRDGVRATATARYVGAFPAFNGIAREDMTAYSVMDASVTLPVRAGMNWSLVARNLLNTPHRELPGSPYLGRMLMTRVEVRF